ncbi:ComF family protein [Miniphocaeibacter massiliensis]|uniref:ComF family protein n=1 Tax=Miniphocaeibacter massiliensis TaxID=2041841 RepID=UPI000C1C1094|nr:ComF family protein [Miniphocaeibacter massiliensis]
MGININDLLFLSDGYCYCCKEELYNKKYFCRTCLGLFEYVDTVKSIGEYKCYSPYLYTGRISELIQEFKFNNSVYLYKAFGELLVNYIINKDMKFDSLISVPLTKKKLSKRGYNQSQLLAEYIGDRLGIEILNNILIKNKNTKDQHLLKVSDRAKNLKNSFRVVNGDKLRNKNILLIDDIITSGYTIKTILDVLDKFEPESIKALTIASSKIESKYKFDFKNI